MRTGGRFEYHTLLKQKIVSPRFCIAYKVSPNSQFSGCYGQFSEQPQDENLVYNHLLHTENAEHYIVNYQYTGDKRIFRIEAYYKNYDHLVKYDSLYSVYPESY